MKSDLYDIGDLKNDPAVLYDVAILFSQFFEGCRPDQDVEIWSVLEKVNRSLWANLPAVVTIDFRDPDDPETWGDFDSPSSAG